MIGNRKAGLPRLAVGAHDKRFTEQDGPPPRADAPASAPAQPRQPWYARSVRLLKRGAAWIVSVARNDGSRVSHDASLPERTRTREELTEILLVIPSAGTMVLTYYGIALPLTETGSTAVQKGQALFFAATIGVFAWLAWFFLFGLIYRLSGKRLALALFGGVVMVGTLAVIDAPFNMLALAGGPATQMSLVAMAHRYEQARDAVLTRASKVRQLLPAIRVQANRFASLRAQEVKTGTFSGKAAPGKVSAAFGQIADQLGGLADQLDAGLAKTDTLQTQLNASLGELKTATYRPGPMRGRMESASAAGDKLDGLLTQAGQYDFAASVEATLASLDSSLVHGPSGASSVPVTTTVVPAAKAGKGTKSGRGSKGGQIALVDTPAFAQQQAAEIDGIAAMVKPVAAVLRGSLAELHGAEASTPEPLRPESPLTAIRTYWRELLPHWCAALFIDLAPGALLLILIAAWREADRAKPADATPPAETTPPASNDDGDQA